MTRRNTYLVAIMVMGAIVTTVGGTGIFAVFTDRAVQGTNTINSGARPSAADIQIASASVDQTNVVQCGPFQDNLTTQIWTVSNVQPGDSALRYMCLKNNGAADFDASLAVLDMVNSDNTCTGDEATVDTNCGTGVGAGQLGDSLHVMVYGADCATAGIGNGTGTYLGSMAVQAGQFTQAPIPAGATRCLAIDVSYPSSTLESTVQAAQSDSVSWKFAFDVAATE